MCLKAFLALVPSVLASFLALPVASSGLEQQRLPLSIESIFSKESMRLASVPECIWLDDNTAILYDHRQPEAHQTFERLDPVTGERNPLFDMHKAVASLKSLVPSTGTDEPLSWPDAFDSAGRHAAYLLDGDIFLLDFASSSFIRVTNTKEEEKSVQFSPDSRWLSYVRANDLYVYELASNKETRLTFDGSPTLLNGTLTWVYWEEIFGRRDIGYWWSPDSRSIAFLQTDDSAVSESTFVDFQPIEERVIHQRYPKVGESNPRVRVGLTNVSGPDTRWLNLGQEPFEWILRVQWLPDSEGIAVQTMPRSQKENRLDFVNVKTGERQHVLTETESTWVDITDDLHFLPGGRVFLWASERDGFMHLYRYAIDGRLINRVTDGNWSTASSGTAFWVTQSITGIDSQNDWIYFTALKDSALQRNLYRVKGDGSGLTRLSSEPGTHAITMSPNAKFYFDRFSSARELPSLTLRAADGKLLKTLATPRPELLPEGLQYSEFFTVPAADGFPLPAQIWKPKNFDPAHKYPVILYVYGGPSAPTVQDGWSQGSFLINQLYLQDGYLVINLDARASTGISKTLANSVAANPDLSQAGDLLAGVRWLKSQPWVDPTRVGVWGWSGGGTMTLHLMTLSKEFKAGISVAPVTDHRFYDSKWMEAYVGMLPERADLYDRLSIVKRAGDLSGHLLIVFGTYDDNVHPQNEQALINALIAKNILFEVMLYPMRMHGISDPPASIHLFGTMREFWRRNL